MTRDLFYEIGTEEIPARFINNAIDDIKRIATENLKELRIKFESIDVYATPRRFAILIKNMEEKQADLEETFKGPAKKIALDANGEPTKALIGFVKGKKGNLDQVEFIDINGEEYSQITVFSQGEDTKFYIKQILESIIRNMNFPKPMKWGNKNLKFIRPIRWLISIFGEEIISFEIEGIVSSNITKGHRFLGKKEISVVNFKDYKDKLEENYVILDHIERRKIIEKQVEEVARSIHGTAIINPEILDEVNFIVEYPTAFYGEYNKEYLQLPKEVVTTPMENHQRYFPVVDKDSNLLNYFITVRNGDSYMIDNVRKGNLKVLDARLQDAKFFFSEDTKKPLEAYIPNLETIIFHQKLGTMLDKVDRLKKSSVQIANKLAFTSENVERTAELCKADLTTQMVFEFGELQGTMGSYYSAISGENKAVAVGIFEHYLPRNADDIPPATEEGIAVALADKIDTIAGFFSIGIIPTGSQDQYALRRQAIGILKILIERQLDITIEELVEIGLLNIYDKVDPQTSDTIITFMNMRLNNIILDKGIRYDIVNAVVSKPKLAVYKIIEMAMNIEEWFINDKTEVLTAFQRGYNLSKKCTDTDIDINPNLFEHEAEAKLFEAVNEIKDQHAANVAAGNYKKALCLAENLVVNINDLFDNVMIMHENVSIKNNRLKLINFAVKHISDIFDLDKIVY